MGGRGTFSKGKEVSLNFVISKRIMGIKVLEGINGKHGLPAESHSSDAYICLHVNGRVKQLRLYNDDRTSKTDIECSTHRGK